MAFDATGSPAPIIDSFAIFPKDCRKTGDDPKSDGMGVESILLGNRQYSTGRRQAETIQPQKKENEL
jgi:hypothetical protein